ncbi:uricase-like [Episyrphus balteatus]|uniref:uricase-like n=1 Tax=Episyrphus balteatus TaxID=286459 RepID=UPI0024858E5F|nr:uricase-like [Episyrphus balteatus]
MSALKDTSSLPDPKCSQFWSDDNGYDKKGVRVMALVKDDSYHRIREFTVTTNLKLATYGGNYDAKNKEIIGNDLQEVTILKHAKKYGLSSPEDFALSLTKHFLDTYPDLEETHVRVEENPWERLGQHSYAFSLTSTVKHFCDVVRNRNDPEPFVISGIHGLRVMKTAQSPFVDNVKARFHTEGDQKDRIMCADVFAKWQYWTVDNVDFTRNWHQIKDLILQVFTEMTTTSIQSISYKIEKLVLNKIEQISSIAITLPNTRYPECNFSRFEELETNIDNLSIYQPTEKTKEIEYSNLDQLLCGIKSKM